MTPTEKPSLSNTHEDAFEALLKQQLQGSEDYIDDNGFTARVISELPPARSLSKRMEQCIIGLPVLVISLLVLIQLPWQLLNATFWTALFALNLTNLLLIGGALFALTVVLSVIYAIPKILR